MNTYMYLYICLYCHIHTFVREHLLLMCLARLSYVPPSSPAAYSATLMELGVGSGDVR